MLRLFLGFAYSFVVAFWTLGFLFGIREIYQSLKKEWYLPDPNMFGPKAGVFYVSERLLWILASIGLVIVSIVQLIQVWKAVLAL